MPNGGVDAVHERVAGAFHYHSLLVAASGESVGFSHIRSQSTCSWHLSLPLSSPLSCRCAGCRCQSRGRVALSAPPPLSMDSRRLPPVGFGFIFNHCCCSVPPPSYEVGEAVLEVLRFDSPARSVGFGVKWHCNLHTLQSLSPRNEDSVPCLSCWQTRRIRRSLLSLVRIRLSSAVLVSDIGISNGGGG